MPPIEPSLRRSLLTGASALALSVVGSEARAQGTPPGQTIPPQVTLWVEGALFYTAGGNFNIPSLPGLGPPFTSFSPQGGIEGAFGFDYRFDNDPLWHYVFDFRYGRSRTATSSSSSSSSTHSTSFKTNGLVSGVLQTTTIRTASSSSGATQASEWGSHLVADFMIGRDIGVGANVPELELGLRIADLRAVAQAQETATLATTTSIKRTFYQPTNFGGGFARTTHSTSSSMSATSASATWNSEFFGFGPRAAVTGGVPIIGFWTFDYGAGVAGLFGPRSFSFNGSGIAGAGFFNTGPMGFVFNADGWGALSYWFTPNVKLSAGIRGDFYDSALTTYNVNTGGLQTVSRLYWGPFVRLTGAF